MVANELVKDSSYKVFFISLFEEQPQPFFPIDEAIKRDTVYSTVTHGIQHYFDTVKQLRGLVKKHHIDVLIDIDGIRHVYVAIETWHGCEGHLLGAFQLSAESRCALP